VRELLATVDSYELSEWVAYERVFGPIGSRYNDEMLAQQHEILQSVAYLLGAQVTPKGQKNPIPIPKHTPRPDEQFVQEKDESIVSQAEFDRSFRNK
jgi:hypothetical protein